MSSASADANANFPDCAIAQFVGERHAAYGDKPALIDGSTERIITYTELSKDVRTIAAGLGQLGVSRGDVVAVFGPNSPDYVALFYGVTSAGAAITSLNVIHNAAELSYQLIDSGARTLVLACEATPALQAAIRKAKIDLVAGLDQVRMAGTATVDEQRPAMCDAAVDVASITYTAAPSDVPMGVMV
jgi:acyl-CoA synthetase (AMP-forming)/AMP-acid ligase II